MSIGARSIPANLPAVILLFLCCMVVLTACEQDRASPAPQLTVKAYEVGSAVVKRERKFHGRVVPADLTRVSFRIPGKIAHLAVQAGQEVKAGQVVARIEDTIQRQVLADAEAQYQLSQRQLARADNLHQRGALTAAQRDRFKASFRLARARLKQAEANLSYTVVNAPFDGTVAEVQKELYEAVDSGETVTTVYRSDRTDVLVNIPDLLPSKFHQARDFNAIKVSAVFSGSAEVHTLSILKGSTARHPKTQTFQLWLTMPAPASPYPPGLPATVITDLEEAGFSTEVGLLVPLTALQAGAQEGVFRVWRIEGDVVMPATVQVGRITQDGALITSGVQQGDLIATSALSRLAPGQAVNFQLQHQLQQQGQ